MSNVLLLNAILADNDWLRTQINGSGAGYSSSAWVSCPTNTTNWSSIPRLTGGTSLNVCDVSGYYRCGVCCLWTVPGGVSIAQFQIWGAGSGTAPGSCCSGSPPGDTGAYAIAIIPVTPGCQYTLCSGCARCCCSYCTVSADSLGGCDSFVSGFGLTNFCAQGGSNGHTYCTMVDLHGNDGCCRYNALGQRSAGPCICSGSVWYCFSNSCATCGLISIRASARTYYGSATSGYVTGLPSFHAGGCLTSDHYGYFCHSPVISETHGVFTGSNCCATFSSGTCCGGWNCSAANTESGRRHPGGGGAMTHMMGGHTEHYGDSGRMGMVRVTYC